MTESLESLLLLALFILLPLIERMLRAARRPDRDSSEPPPGPRPVARPSIPSPVPPQQPPFEAHVPPPADIPQVPARPAPRRSPPPLRPAAGAPAAGAPAAARSRTPLEELHTRHALRRAIVLATILGPCRAVDPYERR